MPNWIFRQIRPGTVHSLVIAKLPTRQQEVLASLKNVRKKRQPQWVAVEELSVCCTRQGSNWGLQEERVSQDDYQSLKAPEPLQPRILRYPWVYSCPSLAICSSELQGNSVPATGI